MATSYRRVSDNFACTTLQLEFSVYSGKKSCKKKICKKPGINKQRFKKKKKSRNSGSLASMISAQRSETIVWGIAELSSNFDGREDAF